MSTSECSFKREQSVQHYFVSIDDKCDEWAQSSSSSVANSPPCFEILSQFYDELMISTFPLEDERDDLDDWYERFRMQMKQRQWKHQGVESNQELTEGEKLILRGNAIDVILIITVNFGEKTEDDSNDSHQKGLYTPLPPDSDKKFAHNPVIIGGAAIEYYKESRVGLLSYIVIGSDFRGCGFATHLHNEALSRLQRLANLYGSAAINNIIGGNPTPLVQAVFAETNTAAAGDVTPEQSMMRHNSLFKLGYRLVLFPYAQPPLCTEDVDASFDEVLLLVYFPFRLDDDAPTNLDSEVNTKISDGTGAFYSWFLGLDEKMLGKMKVSIPFSYVEEFYKTVFGYLDLEVTPFYRSSKYYQLANWFSHSRDASGLVKVSLGQPPWEDCKVLLLSELSDWQRKR